MIMSGITGTPADLVLQLKKILLNMGAGASVGEAAAPFETAEAALAQVRRRKKLIPGSLRTA